MMYFQVVILFCMVRYAIISVSIVKNWDQNKWSVLSHFPHLVYKKTQTNKQTKKLLWQST